MQALDIIYGKTKLALANEELRLFDAHSLPSSRIPFFVRASTKQSRLTSLSSTEPLMVTFILDNIIFNHYIQEYTESI